MASEQGGFLDDIAITLELCVHGFCREGSRIRLPQDVLDLNLMFYAKSMLMFLRFAKSDQSRYRLFCPVRGMWEGIQAYAKIDDPATYFQNIMDEEDKEPIAELTAEVEQQFQAIKPEIEAAQIAVCNIKTRQLDQISFKKPPDSVEKTFNAVCLLLGEETQDDWGHIQVIMAGKGFLQDIQQFYTNRVTRETRMRVTQNFLSDPEWEFESINKCSTVAGSFLLWVNAQIKFSYLLDEIKPVAEEIKNMKEAMVVKVKERKELVAEFQKEIEENQFE